MAAFADYSELVIAAGEYLNRADLVDVMPRFVAMAEAKINRRLRDRRMLADVTLTPDETGTCSLPADFLEVERVEAQTAPPRLVAAAAGRYAAGFSQPGGPSVYTITGTALTLRPASATPVVLSYFQALPALETALTNWLIQAYPDIYLYAVVFEAATYARDAASAGAAAQLFGDALEAADVDNRRARWSNVGFRSLEATP
ncbi:phage adaptor protein [Phreatobacter stygius]|uniref:Uncharacterized protein n=1 Tax=Phreatobacter stygius TaxID=1940610 RepID=A0A4D7B1P0_9HYPH|nr:hypothetical protein [Phreatobacter stygius]QCI67524.1 hypothetical protein E8M01_26850 [Phreatobacter stygius]